MENEGYMSVMPQVGTTWGITGGGCVRGSLGLEPLACGLGVTWSDAREPAAPGGRSGAGGVRDGDGVGRAAGSDIGVGGGAPTGSHTMAPTTAKLPPIHITAMTPAVRRMR